MLNKLAGKVNYGYQSTRQNPTYLMTTSRGTKYNKRWWHPKEEAILKLFEGPKLEMGLVSTLNTRKDKLNLLETH